MTTNITSDYSIRTANWAEDKDQLMAIRYAVFVDEQSVPVEIEQDEHDQTAMHWLVTDTKGEPIATARMMPDGHIGRMAVVRHYRSQGVGSALLTQILADAKSHNLLQATLGAQIHALDFYRKLGFIEEGDEYMEAGIAHIRMTKRLAESRMLGVHGGDFSVNNLAKTAFELISQVNRYLRVLFYDLDHTVFDNEAMSRVISTLARKSRYTDVRLLVIDTTPMVKRGHRLLTLQRRIPTAIGLKVVSCEPRDIKNNLILADDIGILCQSIKEKEHIWANFNNRPVTTNHIIQFDDLWDRAIEDKNLRMLDI